MQVLAATRPVPLTQASGLLLAEDLGAGRRARRITSLAAGKAGSSMRYSTSKTAGHGQLIRARVAGRET